jgi:hypothetical protein
MRSLWPIALMGVMLVFLAGFGVSVITPVGAADGGDAESMPICTLSKCLNPRVTTKSGVGTANAAVEAKVTAEDAAKWCATYKPMDKLCAVEQVKSGWIGFRNLYRASADCVAGRMTAIDGNSYIYAGVWEDGPGKGRAKFASSTTRVPAKKWDETGVDIHPSGSITGWGGGSPNLAAQWEVLCAGASAPVVAVVSAPQPVVQVPNAVQLRPNELQQATTETQLQTADFGTPEATAKIAAKAGFVDVVGVKLGMPLKAALDMLKAHNSNLVMEPVTLPPYEALPGVVMTPWLASKKNTNMPSSEEKESVGVLVTVTPSEPFVWAMWREVWYEKEDSRPTVDTILTGLRKKYGQESMNEGTRLTWLYDSQGQQVVKPKANEVMNKCVSVWTVGMAVTTQLQPGYINRQIVGGYFNASYGKDPFTGLCQSYAVVQAEYLAQSPLGKTSPPLIVNVAVRASNRRLEVSGVTAAHGLLVGEATKLAEKRKGDAAKREVPKF